MPGWERDRVWLHDQKLEDMPEYLELSIRIRNRLTSQGIRTLGELLATPSETLLAINGFGEKCLREAEDFVTEVTRDPDQRFTRFPQNSATKMKRPRLGFGRLNDLTRACLEEIGVMDEGDLHKRTLGEILEALMYDSDSVDELWECCGVPEPLGEEELLGLLSASETARKRLDISLHNGQKAYLDLLTGCAELVHEQVAEGYLHPQALMNYMPLQSINERLSPPARDLSELLSVAERGALEISAATLKKLETSLRTEFLGEELEALLGILDERELQVLRGRYAPSKRTLEAVANDIGVSRERIRQMQDASRKILKEAYRLKLPLPRLRSAMLIVFEEKAFSAERMRDVLVARGIVGEEEELDDFLVLWNALESKGTDVTDHQHQWRVLDREAYRFPEDIRMVFKTGYTQAQTEIAQKFMPLVRKRCSRSGYFSLNEVLSAAFGDEPPEDGDVMHVLLGHGCSRVTEKYWLGSTSGYNTLHTVARKMLDWCGALDTATLRQGMVRHQKRFRVSVPPLDVIDALLRRYDDISVEEDGRFKTAEDAREIQSLGRQEQTWLRLIEKHGPVVTFGQIARAFDDAGLSRTSAGALITYSELVFRCVPNRYCLPGQLPDVGALSDPIEDEPVSLDLDFPSGGRTQLVMDLNDSHALRLHVSETRWPGEVEVSFIWNEEESNLRTRYLAYDDVTIAGPHSVAVTGSEWDDVAILSGPDSFVNLSVPAPPIRRSLVFLASDGRRVKNWREGQKHLVLLSQANFDEDLAAMVFDHYDVLGSPPGWESHCLLRVSVRMSLLRGERVTLQKLENAAHHMGLPSFKALHRVRSRLLGPQIPEAEGAAEAGTSVAVSKFTESRPPSLEIGGLWDGTLRVEMFRIESSGGRRETRADVLDLTSDGHTHTIDLWESRPDLGLYRIRTEGCQNILFEIVRNSDKENRVLDIQLSPQANSSTGERSDTERFVVRAWPRAKLRATLVCGASWRRSVTLEVGESGIWEGDFSELGIVNLPDEGEIEVSVSWKNLVTCKVSLRGRTCGYDVNRFEWRDIAGERVLALGDSQVGDGLAILNEDTFVLGERPWLGEVWEPVVRGLPGGGRAVVVPAAVDPTWSVELADSEPEETRVSPVKAEGKIAINPHFGFEDLIGSEDAAGRESWRTVSTSLRRIPLPPALRRKVGVGELCETIQGSIVDFPARPRWKALDESLLEELKQWGRYGLQMLVVAFAPGAGSENELGVEGEIEAFTADAPSLANEGESNLFYKYKDGRSRKTNIIVHHRRDEDTADGNSYFLNVGETLYVCLNCGLYLPPGKFTYHDPVSYGRDSCQSSRRSYRTVSSGAEVGVELWVYMDPVRFIRACENVVRRVCEGEDNVPASAESWLGQVVEAYNAEARDGEEPGEWFARASGYLLDLKQLTKRLARDGERETSLAEMGWSSLSYRRGIEVISEWVQSEMGGR